MDLFALDGRVAVVTGGNGGIGLGMAKGLARAGASIVVAARDAKKNKAAVRELEALSAQVLAVETDVRQTESCRTLFSKAADAFGAVDILINNAGMNVRLQPEEYDIDSWNTVLETNLTSAMLCSKYAHPLMARQGGGKIINIGSMMSIFGSSYAPAYAASKGGVVQYTKSCAVAYSKYNVQVNAILPGWIVTEMTDEFGRLFPERYAAIEGRTPSGRWGQPQDLAGTAVFLASSASQFVSGVSIPIDGGYSVQ